MKTTRLIFVLGLVWISVTTSGARVFDTEQEYVRQYGANVNKGAPAPPPHKFAIYFRKTLRILVLFENQVSQGEVISKPKGRLSAGEVPGLLAANQGSSVWKKEQIETAQDPKALQTTLWSRADGKLFAAYIVGGPTPVVVIGTRSGGVFLMKQKDNLASYVKD
ncbi:MAG: hypothetical protein JWO45_1557 [Spartobacteria bacterium]|nr:hypothetical protein [Spartobacteria bacterium]